MNVGGVQIGGGAPVVVQTMTKTETANLARDDGPDPHASPRRAPTSCASPCRATRTSRRCKTIVRESPIPVIADIHFNHTLALKAIDAGAHCIRLNPGNIGGPDKVAEVADRARAAGTPMRIGVNSGSLPKHLHALERENPVEALVTAAVEFVRADGAPRLRATSRSRSSRPTCPNTIAANRLLSRADPLPAAPRDHRGGHEVVGLAQVARSASARCWPTGSATRSASRSRPSTPRRRSRSPGRSSRRSSCASAARC